MTAKIRHARDLIKTYLDMFKRPCVLCSFGKDSMLVLGLVREIVPEIPVVWFIPKFKPAKFKFAMDVITQWNLNVITDVPPLGTCITSGNGKCEVVNKYPVGGKYLAVPVGKSEGASMCGKEEFLDRNVGNYVWPYDVSFHGHRGDDVDDVQGDVPIKNDLKLNVGCTSFAYPIRDFTEPEVFDACRALNIPIDEDRYILKVSNADRWPYCNACFNPNEGPSVLCPKYGISLNNISSQLETLDMRGL